VGQTAAEQPFFIMLHHHFFLVIGSQSEVSSAWMLAVFDALMRYGLE
jgi:hypothetical protein